MAGSNITLVKEEDLATSDPMKGFILSELQSSFATIKHIGDQIKKLVAIVRGELGLDKEIQDIGDSLVAGRVPVDWLNIWEGPLAPADWLSKFFKKMLRMNEWQRLISEKSLLSSELNLSDLFKPETFLNAYRIIIGAELKLPIEELEMKVSFKRDQAGDRCLKLAGLFVQGGKIEGGTLSGLSKDDKREFSMIPNCYLTYVKSEGEKAEDEGMLDVPVYNDFTRERLITILNLPIDGGEGGEDYIKCGCGD